MFAAATPLVDAVSADPFSVDPVTATRKNGDDGGTGLGVATRTRTRTKQPQPYRVLMLNDDYTPMEFVVLCLQRFFRMGLEDATRVMLHVHQKGVGVCGTFTYEVAETKVSQVIEFARANQHPLQCTMEKA
ncbi:MAG: ATP-dependent Clp protease adapter ClpS [Sphingomonas fennica]